MSAFLFAANLAAATFNLMLWGVSGNPIAAGCAIFSACVALIFLFAEVE